MRKSVKRGLIAVFLVSLTIVGIAAVVWRVSGLALVEWLIVEVLAGQGVPVRALVVRSAGSDEAVVTDLHLDLAGGVAIRHIEAEYRLSDLIWDRRLERLVVSGLRVGIAPSDLESAASADGARLGPSPAGLPIDHLAVQDGEIAIATPIGELLLALDLEARTLADGGIAVTGRTGIRGEPGEIDMPFDGGISPAGGFELVSTVNAGRLDWRGAGLDLDQGTLTLAGTLAGIDLIDARFAADLAMPDGSTARLAANARLAEDSGHFDIAVEPGSTLGRVGVTVAVAGMGGPSPMVDLVLDADMPQLGRVAALAGVDTGWASSGMVTASLTGDWDDATDVAIPSFDGHWTVAAELSSAASGDRLSMELAGVLDLDAGAARLRGEEPWRFAWRPAAGGDGIALTLGEDSGESFNAAMERAGGGWTLAAAGPFRLADRHGPLVGGLDLAASIDDIGEALAGRFAVEIGASGSLFGAASVQRARADLAGRLGFDDGRWSLWPDACQPVTAERLTIAERLDLPEGISACLAAMTDRPLLEIATAPWDGAEAAAALRVDPAVMSIDTGAQSRRLELGRLEAAISTRLDGDGEFSTKIATVDAALRLPVEGVALDDVAVTLTAATSSKPRMRLVVDTAAARSLSEPAWFVPLRLSADAILGDDDLVELTAAVRTAGGDLVLDVEGLHDRSSGGGQVEISLDPVSFMPGARQPADIVPALGDAPITDVAGTVSASARIGWGERISSLGELSLEDVAVTLPGAIVRGIDGTLYADSLLPLSLPDGQLLALGGVETGVALGEGAVAFGLADGNRLAIQGIGLGLAGGSVAVAPFDMVIGDRELPMVITMQGIDLAELSEQFLIEGLTVTGNLDGRVPIRLIEDTISVEDGVLETTGAGLIRYVTTLPMGPPGEGGVDLLLSAVQNFHYERLRATLNGRTGEDLEVAIQLTGANPDLYDGYPIALNVNLSGALEEVLRSGLRSMAIAEDAGDLLRGD